MVFLEFSLLVLQKTLIIINIFVLSLKNYIASAPTVITNIFINELISPIPYLKDNLLSIKKACAITIVTRIASYSYLIFFLFHKHNRPFSGKPCL